jgi:hypothetical protein
MSTQAKDFNGKTPLQVAEENKREAAAAVLRGAGKL